MYYVSHCFGGKPENYESAKRITRTLQITDPDNVYICPLVAFSHLGYNQLGYEVEMAMCLDLLAKCDRLIVTSDVSEGVKREIRFAVENDIPIEFVDEVEGV